MPSSLRSRIALILMLGAFLIPIGMSSLRGLTHVLTCNEAAETPFTLITPEGMEPQLLSSTILEKGDEEFLCASRDGGGLTLNMAARSEGPGKVSMILPITNHSDHEWQGTVTLVVGGTSFPVRIGKIPGGETRTDTIPLELDDGELEVNGSLLIGP